jgi:hypothetical protein
MAGNDLIDGYLADLARWLPADAVDELADGISETYQNHLDHGLTPEDAAAAAVADFGGADEIIAAFTRNSPGRRTARLLLFTGPAVGMSWGAALIAGRIWTWHIPIAAGVAFGMTLLTVVVLLVAAASSRCDYGRTKLAALAGSGIILLDLTMLASVVAIAPAIVWPMALSGAASLMRVGFTVRALPRIVAP